MSSESWLWPEEYKDFWVIENQEHTVNISWTKNPFQDYMKLSIDFFDCGFHVIENVIESGHDNTKSDMWFMPGVFMIRQSIELGLKALICRIYSKNSDIQTAFKTCCHNLAKLYSIYTTLTEKHLTQSEENWLTKYFASIEVVDEKSDLFRFPFEDDFLKQYRNLFLDNVDVANNLLQAFALIRKCLEYGDCKPEDEFDSNLKPDFLILASHGIGNCYLWQPISDDGFHSKVTGYLSVADYIFNLDKINCENKVYPLMFLLRNGLELCLKRLFYSRVENGVALHIFQAKKRSHLIKKELWKNVRPVIEYYANEQGNDLATIDIVERELFQINNMDQNGDMFRYPTSYSLEYRLNNVTIDLKYAFEYIRAILNFLNGCDSMLDVVADYEMEMNSYYEW